MSWTSPINNNPFVTLNPFVTGYNIYQTIALQSLTSDSKVNQTNILPGTTSYTIIGLTPGTEYTFYVKAVYNEIESSDVSVIKLAPYYLEIDAIDNSMSCNHSKASGTIVFDKNDTFTINSAAPGAIINVICIGGGGNGGNGSSTSGGVGGGGGGMRTTSFAASNYQPGTFNVSVANGGQNGSISSVTYNGNTILSAENGKDGGAGGVGGGGKGGVGDSGSVSGENGIDSSQISAFTTNDCTYDINFGAAGGGGSILNYPIHDGGYIGGGDGSNSSGNGAHAVSSYSVLQNSQSQNTFTLYYGNGGGGGSNVSNGGRGSQGIVIIYWNS